MHFCISAILSRTLPIARFYRSGVSTRCHPRPRIGNPACNIALQLEVSRLCRCFCCRCTLASFKIYSALQSSLTSLVLSPRPPHHDGSSASARVLRIQLQCHPFRVQGAPLPPQEIVHIPHPLPPPPLPSTAKNTSPGQQI